jgi:hypothetical protein
VFGISRRWTPGQRDHNRPCRLFSHSSGKPITRSERRRAAENANALQAGKRCSPTPLPVASGNTAGDAKQAAHHAAAAQAQRFAALRW